MFLDNLTGTVFYPIVPAINQAPATLRPEVIAKLTDFLYYRQLTENKVLMMFYLLSLVTIVCFLAHVYFLFAAFAKNGFHERQYFYSHLTLWITGGLFFLLVVCFSRTGVFDFLDYFDTPLKRGMILVVPVALSLLVHGIVRSFVLPSRRASGN